MKKYLNVQEVAAILDCCDEHVRRLAKSKRLRSKSISAAGGRDNFRFKPEWIDEFMESESEESKQESPSKTKPISLVRSTHMKLARS